MRWTEQPIHFIDFEGSLDSGILEYGVATVLRGSVAAARGRLCAARGRIDPADSRVHGLDEAALRGREPFSSDWELFVSLRGDGPLAAHYAGTEHALIRSVWPYPRQVPDFARPGQGTVDWGPWIDTARLYGQLYPSLTSGRLEAVVGSCGLQPELDALAGRFCEAGRRRYHAALYDALAGALLLASLARHEATAGLTVMQLLALSTLDPKRREGFVQPELF